ncbi:MAG: ribonuclease D [Rhodovarius sp.]|nr:ribonuclease D [Rhodovarius sp.]MCX7933177.1 ribonuclease D [Rhodovarius sp.]MDW8314407.1 ribonuclease D [Rhodovarius sp.]
MPRRLPPAFPPPRLIADSLALAELCERLGKEPFIAVDTEFMRERTYWPELCLVQLGGAEEIAVVDALAPGLDLAPLGRLLANPGVTKVFHAARQDVEIFLHRFGSVPSPLFDTQIAAMVAGFGDQASYEALARALAGASIDKAHRFSDWSVRPLSSAQIAYAAADVTYLRVIYEVLLDRLEEEGRLDWVADEMAALADPASYAHDPETAWEKLRPRSSNRRYLAVLRAVAAWREREAQRINIPRQRLIKDETLLEIAASMPSTAAELARARGITEGFAKGKSGAGLLAAIAEARALPEEALPHPPAPRQGPPPSPALIALLKVLLAAKAEQHEVAPRLLASAEELERLATEAAPDIPALRGWRRHIFGEAALALKQGRLALGVDGRKVRLIEA